MAQLRTFLSPEIVSLQTEELDLQPSTLARCASEPATTVVINAMTISRTAGLSCSSRHIEAYSALKTHRIIQPYSRSESPPPTLNYHKF
ncbi:hypothetical protein EVAR_25741_1 [Eumeta japonica]|uniref:Uncharacterized protein n=1 Tax=Eumeta variegata TaxID=151549 RepID=A0A4C1V8X5_EUMVA|nr:hypothetical protein EVAR_25741_1 [Eumeta japonica]